MKNLSLDRTFSLGLEFGEKWWFDSVEETRYLQTWNIWTFVKKTRQNRTLVNIFHRNDDRIRQAVRKTYLNRGNKWIEHIYIFALEITIEYGRHVDNKYLNRWDQRIELMWIFALEITTEYGRHVDNKYLNRWNKWIDLSEL